MNPILKRIASDEYAACVMCSHSGALYRLLQRLPTVRAIPKALEAEVLTEDEIMVFVSDLLKDFKPAVAFPHDSVLAILAVALKDRQTPFAREFVEDLAALRASELQFSPDVARLALGL